MKVRGPQRVVRLLRKPRSLIDIGRMRDDLVRADGPDGVADGLVLVAQPVQVEACFHVPDRRVPEGRSRRIRASQVPSSHSQPPSKEARERADLGDRNRLPGRRARGRHGRARHSVVGVDVDPVKIAALQEGRAPFYEPDLDPLLRKHVDGGRLRFSTKMALPGPTSISSASARRSGSDGLAADLKYLDAAIDTLAAVLRRPCLVVGKSTVPVGTARRLRRAWPRRHRRVTASSWRGTRSFCARGTPSRTRCTRTGWSSACTRSAGSGP